MRNQDEKDSRNMLWNRRRFLQVAAAATGAAVSVPMEAESRQTGPADSTRGHDPALVDEPVLPEWAIGPFTRFANPRAVPYEGNPLIYPVGQWQGENPGWESESTYNPGVIYYNGKFQLLYRAGRPKERSQTGSFSVGYASSTDGYHFTRYAGNPVIENVGNVDPRLYRVNGKVYAYYTGKGIHVASSTDMIHWDKLGTVVPDVEDAFDPALIADPEGNPVKIGGRYAMYYGFGPHSAHLMFSEDLVHWTDTEPVDLHFPDSYNPWEVCFAVTDYPTVQGRPVNHDILMFVGGTLMAQGRWYYALSEVLFSRDKPSHQIGQLTFPILEPQMPYEVLGDAFRTVWMNSIFLHQGKWWMYYGAADTVCCLAHAPLRSQGALDLYNNFRGTSFETNQRQPDWIDSVDTDPGGGGIKNVGEFIHSGIGGPQAMVTFGYLPPLEYSRPKGIQDAANPYVRIYDRRAHSGCASLLYMGRALGKDENYAYLKLFDLSRAPVTVTSSTKLSYWVYPEDGESYPLTHGINSTHIALDLIFSDGTALRNLHAQDQHGNGLTPEGQGGHLGLNQWNHVESAIGAVAAGKRIVRIDIGYSQPNASGSYRGFIDDIVLD